MAVTYPDVKTVGELQDLRPAVAAHPAFAELLADLTAEYNGTVPLGFSDVRAALIGDDVKASGFDVLTVALGAWEDAR